ncbi:unnamed protein product, partial [Meganyctiphanes norvegica]
MNLCKCYRTYVRLTSSSRFAVLFIRKVITNTLFSPPLQIPFSHLQPYISNYEYVRNIKSYRNGAKYNPKIHSRYPQHMYANFTDPKYEHHSNIIHSPTRIKWAGLPPSRPKLTGPLMYDLSAANWQKVAKNVYFTKLATQTVSWLRHKDVHLLTVGRYTYTSDRRFQPQHTPGAEDWGLLLAHPDVGDAGRYECQVSSTPPVSHTLKLNVLEPETHIIGGPELFIDRGSTINLTCLVINTPSPPMELIWLHHGQEVGFASSRKSGVGVWTVKGDNTTSSSVLVRDAGNQDAGPYTCTPSPPAPSANVTVHVLDGSLSAPMQQSKAAFAFTSCHTSTVYLILAVLHLT